MEYKVLQRDEVATKTETKTKELAYLISVTSFSLINILICCFTGVSCLLYFSVARCSLLIIQLSQAKCSEIFIVLNCKQS